MTSHLAAWIVLAIGAIVSAALVVGSPDDVGVKVLAMTVLWLSSVVSVRMDLAHPFVWLGGTFLLYTASGPLLFHLGLHPNVGWSGMLIEEFDFSFAMDLQYMAFLVVCAMIGPGRVTFEPMLRDTRFQALFGGAALAEVGINIQMITTSEIKISVIIEEKFLELAVRALRYPTLAVRFISHLLKVLTFT